MLTTKPGCAADTHVKMRKVFFSDKDLNAVRFGIEIIITANTALSQVESAWVEVDMKRRDGIPAYTHGGGGYWDISCPTPTGNIIPKIKLTALNVERFWGWLDHELSQPESKIG